MLERKIIVTSDGSTTIYLPKWDEYYHSKYGAIQESKHVFINNGLHLFGAKTEVDILEIGFGTGLNCFLSYLSAKEKNLRINYTAIEAFPLGEDEIKQLNYVKELNEESEGCIFEKMHNIKWEEKYEITPFFTLVKQAKRIEEITSDNMYNLVYFDAFGARVQPELWTKIIFRKMYASLRPGGIMVTYSAKGSVRRALKSVGFMVERLAGPPGKREMLRAVKDSR